MEKLNEHIKSRLQSLKDYRKDLEPFWKKLAEMCSFSPEIWTEDKRRRRQNVFDNTPRNALTYFSASFKSVLVPTTQRWHRLKSSKPEWENNDAVKAYLQYATDLLFRVRYAPSSNFASESDVLFNQLGIYGTGYWSVEENVGKGIIYRAVPANEIYIGRNPHGVLDTVYREFKLSAKDAYELYGDAVSDDIKKCLSKEPGRQFCFVHAVEPRKDRNPRAKDYTGMKYASYHLEVESDKVIKEGGYRTIPYMAPRFLALEGTPYGDSPGLQAFNDILTANEMGKTILRTGQLQANPPVLVGNTMLDSGKLGQAGAIIRGGMDNQGRPVAASMQYGNNLAITLEMQQDVRASINQAFLIPLFQALTQDKEMTATEVEKREVEKAMLLAPMCERIAAEWLYPMITRELDILSQYGLLDGVPDELLEDGSIAIEFENPAVHMQESSRILGLYKTIEATMTMAQADPSSLDILNFPEALRQIADYYDVDVAAIRSRDEVAALGQQRAQAQAAENLLNASEVVTKSMKNLKGTGFGWA